jgi:tRNA A37 N6-isopentenylltransferase MiaA
MIASGLVEEVKKLVAKGYGFELPPCQVSVTADRIFPPGKN